MVRSVRHRIAVDIGGTFTDVALETPERHYTAKTLTTKGQPENGVLSGIRDVLNQSGIAPSQVTSLIYGTTLATNLLIERGGAPIALLTTRGFRDSIEMRNENRFEQYDVNIDLPAPLVPRAMRFSISERISAGGDVLLPLNENDVRTLTPSLLAAGVRSIAIGFLHSYRNGAHEQRVRDILREELPAIEVTLSSEVSPEMREFERISTACANAYVQPLMSGHLRALDERLREAGLTCPLFLMLSGGGITTLDTAVRFPVRLVESGPAGGAIFSSHIATELGLDEVMSYDMGGTTAKICLIDGGQPQTARTFEVAREYRFLKGSGIPLRIPVIEMVEIGAGGGSIAGVDAMQRISGGPGSAGSDPGPACYGLGGSSPTVTDADVTLGRIDPNNFAGGRMRLDALAAGEVLSEAVAKPLGFSVEHAALGVSEIVDENMANAARVHAIESGKSIDTRTIVAFGGAAPIHVCRLAEKLGVRKVVIPLGAGVGSALGFLRAPVSYEVIRSHYQQLSTLDVQKTNELLEAMRNEAVTVVEAGAPGESLEQIQTAFMRYIGQGHEVGVEIPVVVNEVPLRETGAQTLRETFEHEYHRLYERTIPGVEVEVLSWALSVSTPRDVVIAESATTERSVPPPEDQRPLMNPQSGSYSEAPCYSRDALQPGATIVGPAVIVEQDTATVVASGYTAAIHPSGYIVLESKA
ncbi:MAG: hydantoinase/oxoprolinase family protein [Pseudomonadota bacterium]|nr:hydantoinase/oxoprolinase family protein [Pseudomonadota bacterium]